MRIKLLLLPLWVLVGIALMLELGKLLEAQQRNAAMSGMFTASLARMDAFEGQCDDDDRAERLGGNDE